MHDGVPAADLNAAPKGRAPRVSGGNQFVALVIWLLGVATTYQVATVLWPSGVWYAALGVALAAQALMTWLEGPTLRGRPNPISLVVLLFDSLINAGGVYILLSARIGQLPAAQMAADVAGTDPTFSPLAVAGVSLLVGFILAATPEAVWRWRS
jgi:hypothetical protein